MKRSRWPWHRFGFVAFATFLGVVGHPKVTAYGLGEKQQFSINLKSRALVIGPEVTLGEIGRVIVPDPVKRAQLASINLGEAPPPGESTEISLSAVKTRLVKAGFGNFVPYVKGPRAIRVTTAEVEIDKAFLKPQYARHRPAKGQRPPAEIG